MVANTIIGGVSIVKQVNQGVETQNKFKKILYPVTALQSSGSRWILEMVIPYIQNNAYYKICAKKIAIIIMNNYTRIEKPLYIVEKVSYNCNLGIQKLVPYDPTPYSQIISFLLNDLHTAANSLKSAVTFEPKLSLIIDQIEQIAQETIVTSIKQQCDEKRGIAPPQPQPTNTLPPDGWFSGIRNRVSSAYNYVTTPYTYCCNKVTTLVTRIRAPLYQAISESAEGTLSTIFAKVRTQVQTRKNQVETIIIPKATNALLKKGCHIVLFTGLNWMINQCVQTLTNVASEAALRRALPQLEEEELQQYQHTIALTVYYVYWGLLISSYTLKFSAWKNQRIIDNSSIQVISEKVITPLLALKDHESVKDLTDSIIEMFSKTLSMGEHILDIDLQPAITAFKERCQKEINWND